MPAGGHAMEFKNVALTTLAFAALVVPHTAEAHAPA